MRSLSRFRTLVVVTALSVGPALGQWIEQGPGPILFGQDEGIPNDPVSGAINWIALDSTNANIAYLATVNGGVWKTMNATADPPVWTPLTDTQLPGLSIASLTISPVNSNVLYAGTGSTSSFGSDGSAPFGVAKTTDGGATWTVLASATFAGKRISSIVATSLLGGNVVLAANLFERFGLYRSTDGGASFTRISGAPGSGLPDGGVSSIVADPVDPNRFYVGVPSNYLNTGATGPGIYKSVDGGVTWTPVNGLTGQIASLRILLSVHNSPGSAEGSGRAEPTLPPDRRRTGSPGDFAGRERGHRQANWCAEVGAASFCGDERSREQQPVRYRGGGIARTQNIAAGIHRCQKVSGREITAPAA
jgi:hypothetical protein